MKILMVCLGNICRSPLAQGILEKMSEEQNLGLEVDSAGTSAYHIGHAPDRRSINEASLHDIDISNQRARKLTTEDLDYFDLILTMDHSNYQSALSLATNSSQKDKVRMILNFLEPSCNKSVPDPYYDGGFDHTYQLLSGACESVINEIMVST